MSLVEFSTNHVGTRDHVLIKLSRDSCMPKYFVNINLGIYDHNMMDVILQNLVNHELNVSKKGLNITY